MKTYCFLSVVSRGYANAVRYTAGQFKHNIMNLTYAYITIGLPIIMYIYIHYAVFGLTGKDVYQMASG